MGNTTTQADPETGEVIESTSTELVPLAHVRESIISGRPVEIQNPDEVARQIALSLLDASSPEQLFAAPGTTPPTEIMGQNMVLHGVTFMPSTVEDPKACPIYCVMDLEREDHQRIRVSCGGQGLVVQCLRAVEEGWLPWAVRLIEVGQKKANRNRPIYLETAS